MTYNENGVPQLCPRESICSTGGFQIFLIAIARITAFIMYPLVGLTFLSKMHCSVHALSTSYLSEFIPFAELHKDHHKAGMGVTYLAGAHTIVHLIRWISRGDMALLGSRIGPSGFFSMLCFGGTVWSMRGRAKKMKNMTLPKVLATLDIHDYCCFFNMLSYPQSRKTIFRF